MKKFLLLGTLLSLSACSSTGVGLPSVGLDATYNQPLSREAYDNYTARDAYCHDHNHFDDCPVVTQVEDHVSRPGRVVIHRAGLGAAPQK